MKSYERAWLENSVPWRPIDTAPKDGTKVILYHPNWEMYPVGYWDWVEGPCEIEGGGFCLWHVPDEFPWCEDGLLWPEENYLPTHWQPTCEMYTDLAEASND